MDLVAWLRAEWDRATAVVLLVAGIGFAVAGYRGIANSPYVADELAYLASGAIGALFCLATAALLWLSADLHDEWRKLDRIEKAIRDHGAIPSPWPNGNADPAAGPRRRSRPLSHVGPASEGAARIGVLASLAAGAAVTAVGWQAAAGTRDSAHAFSGVAVAVCGLLAASTGVAAYTLCFRRSIRSRQVTLLRPYYLVGAVVPVPVEMPTDTDVLIAAGLTRYHRHGCPAVEGLETTKAKLGGTPVDMAECGICVASGTDA